MLQRVLALITLASLCLLAVMLTTTTPASVGPFGLLVIFISAYLSFIGLISFFLWGLYRVIAYAIPSFRRSKKVHFTFRRAYYFSTVLAAAPVMILGLQSVGGIGWYEFLLIAIFVVIGCLYISKRIY